jgi:chromosome segregation ATPase
MKRIDLLYQMDNLLEECKVCEKKPVGNESSTKKCVGCNTYDKLRAIGGRLGRGKRLVKLSVEQYQDYKAKGYTDSKISEELNCSPNTITNWKKKHLKVLKAENKGGTEIQKQFETNTIQEDLKADNGRLKRELEVREKAIKDLQEEVASLSGENAKNINSVMELEADYNHQRALVINLDAEVENKREQLRQLKEDHVKVCKENEHLWGLLKIKMEG